jgi:hypothetical protein
MTWFLKQKIKRCQVEIEEYNMKLLQTIDRYNVLVAEFNGQNAFQPIILQQSQAEPKVSEQQPEQVSTDMPVAKPATPEPVKKGRWPLKKKSSEPEVLRT